MLCGRNPWQDYGRLGGLQTFMRYGRDHMAEIGQLGGRPRSNSIADLRQQPASEAQIQIKEVKLPNQLSELKKRWKLQNKKGGAG